MEVRMKLGYMEKELVYVSSDRHMLLGCGEDKNNIKNIGETGENITITILSLNRSNLTLRLMDSITECIPEFQGEFLIGDNASHEKEKEIIKQKMKEVPYHCRMIEFDKNYGVAGGRNRLNQYVKTEWIFQLDNDIYFIKNPFLKVQKDLAILGCHFLVMPLLDETKEHIFLYGGNLYVENQGARISVGGGSAYYAERNEVEEQPFLCTFVPGGASIMRKDTFFLAEGYDEGMFVGFEDTEFSMRLFQKGYKVGSCGIASIVHAHPKPEIPVDIAYEKERFSSSKLFESAKYFEKKHGIQVWNPTVEQWINERLRELLNEGKETENLQNTKKIKIALVVDYPDWAFHHIAEQIMKNLSDKYQFKLLFLCHVDNLLSIFLLAEDCQLIHFLWRSWLPSAGEDYTRVYAERLGVTYEEFYQRYVKDKTVTTAVYDHLYLEQDFEITKKLFSNKSSIIDAYTVSSHKLNEIYQKDARILKKPEMVITDGVDLEFFKPERLERFLERKEKSELVIGWAGNSMWAAEQEDFKGYHTLIKPAVEELIEEGCSIKLYIADRSVEKIEYKDMPKYYTNIDLYICASKIEGTPNPILECMACGVPFISTDVGIVKDAAGMKQKEFILRERSKECLKEKIRFLYEHRRVLRELSEENLKRIKAWDWREKTKDFEKFFKLYLGEKI